VEVPFDPFLNVGGVRLSWHALFSLVGMAVAVALVAWRARGLATFEQVYAVALVAIVGGLAGSRVLHVVEEWPQLYAQDPLRALAVWDGGASITGGIVAGALAAAWRARTFGVHVPRFLDAGAVGLGVGMAIGRIGDVINGEHHALPCGDAPGICVAYTHPATSGQGPEIEGPLYSGSQWAGPVHLAVGYELVWDLVVAAIVAWLFTRAPRLGLEGRLLPIFFGVYGLGRFAIGFLRLDGSWLFGIAQAQLVSILFITWAVVAIATRRVERSTALS